MHTSDWSECTTIQHPKLSGIPIPGNSLLGKRYHGLMVRIPASPRLELHFAQKSYLAPFAPVAR